MPMILSPYLLQEGMIHMWGELLTGAVVVAGLSSIFGHKETPEEYQRRHDQIRRGLRESPEEYRARHERNESQGSYRWRHIEMKLGLRETPEQYRARHARNAERARQRNVPYVASDGRTYTHKETPEEYAERKLRNSHR